MTWHIWSEQALDRLFELYEYLQNFPDGIMANAVKKEIKYLEHLRDYGASRGGKEL